MSYQLSMFGRNMDSLIWAPTLPIFQEGVGMLGPGRANLKPSQESSTGRGGGLNLPVSWGIPHRPVTSDKSQCFTIRYIK